MDPWKRLARKEELVLLARTPRDPKFYIGDRDQFFTLGNVRNTRDLLIHHVELPNHDHNCYARADKINSDAWKFMKESILPAPRASELP